MARIPFVFLLLIATTTNAQPTPRADAYASFRPLINWFASLRPSLNPEKLPPLNPPLMYTPSPANTREFTVILSDSALLLKTKKIVVPVPYRTSPYPVDYSVVYQNRLISLFDSTGFVCLSVNSLQRDRAYERKLNTKRFDYHWLLNGQLVGLSGTTYYQFNQSLGWRQYAGPVPMKKQPKLYEDENYIAYSTCRGEFGGVLYFFDKRTGLTHFVESTCARSVIRQSKGYYILSSLGHMMGSASLIRLGNPSALPVFKRLKKYGIPEADSSGLANVVKPAVVFSKHSTQFFAGFLRDDTLNYVVNWGQRTFLAEVRADTLVIRDPLFNSDLYTHEPITTTYGPDLTVVNMDFYGIAREREIACLLFKKGQVVKVSWNIANERPN